MFCSEGRTVFVGSSEGRAMLRARRLLWLISSMKRDRRRRAPLGTDQVHKLTGYDGVFRCVLCGLRRPIGRNREKQRNMIMKTVCPRNAIDRSIGPIDDNPGKISNSKRNQTEMGSSCADLCSLDMDGYPGQCATFGRLAPPRVILDAMTLGQPKKAKIAIATAQP